MLRDSCLQLWIPSVVCTGQAGKATSGLRRRLALRLSLRIDPPRTAHLDPPNHHRIPSRSRSGHTGTIPSVRLGLQEIILRARSALPAPSRNERCGVRDGMPRSKWTLSSPQMIPKHIKAAEVNPDEVSATSFSPPPLRTPTRSPLPPLSSFPFDGYPLSSHPHTPLGDSLRFVPASRCVALGPAFHLGALNEAFTESFAPGLVFQDAWMRGGPTHLRRCNFD